MREELTAEESKPFSFDPRGDSGLYLQTMADGSVFDVRTDPAELLTVGDGLERIL